MENEEKLRYSNPSLNIPGSSSSIGGLTGSGGFDPNLLQQGEKIRSTSKITYFVANIS